MRTWLVDTGPFVAYLDRTDPRHARVAERLDAFTGLLVTTGAVVTEVMHFLKDARGGPAAFAELLVAADARVVETTQPSELVMAVRLMTKYADTPMDYADATLVMLAGELGVTDVLTLDVRGFSTYRTVRGKSFRLVL
jgi:predicted nucleic acid-binding protein